MKENYNNSKRNETMESFKGLIKELVRLAWIVACVIVIPLILLTMCSTGGISIPYDFDNDGKSYNESDIDAYFKWKDDQ